jgi:archaellum component FlaC
MRKVAKPITSFDEITHEMNIEIDDITEEVARALAEICENSDIDTEEVYNSVPGKKFRNLFKMFKRDRRR